MQKITLILVMLFLWLGPAGCSTENDESSTVAETDQQELRVDVQPLSDGQQLRFDLWMEIARELYYMEWDRPALFALRRAQRVLDRAGNFGNVLVDWKWTEEDHIKQLRQLAEGDMESLSLDRLLIPGINEIIEYMIDQTW